MYVIVRLSVHTFKHETRWPIEIEFYLKHHLGGRKAALGFIPDRIRAVVFMATDSSNMVIMGNMVLPLFLCSFYQIHVLAGNKDGHQSLEDFEIRPDLNPDYRVSCP